jgi:hypothetical protein
VLFFAKTGYPYTPQMFRKRPKQENQPPREDPSGRKPSITRDIQADIKGISTSLNVINRNIGFIASSKYSAESELFIGVGRTKL